MQETVVIKTPQFKGGKIDRFHIQRGTFQVEVDGSIIFTPLNNGVNGDHKVYFASYDEAKKCIQ